MPDARATPIVYQGQQPAAAPFPKVVYSGVIGAFGNNIYGIRRVSFVAQAATTDQVIISPNGTCSNGLATPQSFVLAFGTQQATDSYDLTILGGPAEPEPGNIFTQSVGTSATRVVLGFKTTKGKGGRKLPWLSNIQQGDGITEDLYGTYDYITPDGVVHTAPGPTDKIVNTPRVRVKLAMSGMTDISYLKFTGDPDPIYQNKGLAADIDKIKSAIGAGSGGSAYKSGFGIEINGVTPPTGVTLALATGTDLGIGLYDYVFTKRTITHKESGPSAPLAITTTTGNQDVTITLPALDPVNDPLTIGYSIYRSAVGGTGTPISQCSGVTSTTDGTGKTTYQYQIPASYLLSYDPSILATPGTPPLPIDPATGLACTFDSGTGLFMSGLSVFDATLPQTYTSGQGYTFVADHGAGTYTDTASDASIATNKRPPGDNTPEIDTLLATVDETLHSPLKAGLINTGPSGGLLPLGRGLKVNPAIVASVDVSSVAIDAGDDANGVQVKIDDATIKRRDIDAALYSTVGGFTCGTTLDCSFPIYADGKVRTVYDYYFAPDQIFYALQIGSNNTNNDQALGSIGATDQFIKSPASGNHDFSQLLVLATHINADGNDAIGYAGDTTTLYLDGGMFNTGSCRLAQKTSSRGDVPYDQQIFVGVGGWIEVGEDYPSGAVDPSTPGLTHSLFRTPIDFEAQTFFFYDINLEGADIVGNGSLSLSAGLFTGHGIATVPLTVDAPTGQTADLLDLKVNGTKLAWFDAAGALTAPSAHFTGTSTLTNDGRTDHKAITAPATPASGYTSLYSKTVSSVTRLFELRDDGTEIEIGTGSGGTVTSVGLSAPSFLTVGSSPVTGSGTIALTLANQSANTIFAGPTSGGAAAPTFRGLAAADLPLATTSAVGAVEVGANLQVTAGVLKAPAWSILTDGASNLIFAGGDAIDIETF